MTPDDAASPDFGTLSARDRTILSAVVNGRTYSEAARLAECSESTVDRVMARPEVQAAADAARWRRSAQIADTLDRMLPHALSALGGLIIDAETEVVRLRAALGTLDQARRWRDHADLAERVWQLEQDLRADRV